MAKDKIVLAELDVDTRKLVKSMQDTAQEIEKLAEKQEKLKNKGKETSAEFVLNENTLKRLNEAYKTQTAAIQAQTDADGKLLSQKKAVKDAVQEVNKSENEYLQSNERLLALKKNLDSTDKDYEKNLERINGKLQENNNWLKENGSAFTKVVTTMNDYKQQAIDSFNSINILNGGFSGLVSRAQEAGGVGPLVKGAFEGMSAGIGGMTKSALTFIATPFGLVLAAIAAVIALVQNSMDRGTASSEKITKVFTTFSLITDRLMGLLEPLGDILIDGIAAGFDLAGKAAEAAMGWIADGLSLLGFDESAEGVRNFTEEIKTTAAETHNLKAAQEKLAAQMAVQEVNNEKAKQQIDELKKKYEDQTATEQERLDALQKAAAIEKENMAQRKALADEAYNIEVRKAALNKGLTAEEISNLQKQGAAYAEKMMKVKGFSQEEIDALKKAQVEKLHIGGEETKMIQAQADAENKIHVDAEAKREAAAEKARTRAAAEAQKKQQQLNDEITKQKLELEIFIESQGEKARTMKEELELAEKIAARKKEIAQAEYNASAKTANDKLALSLENMRIDKDVAEAQMNLTMANAQKELDTIKANNATKIAEGKFLSDELYQAEKARLDNIEKAEIAFQAQRLASGIITQETYNAEIKKISDKFNEDEKTLKSQRDEAEKGEKLLKLENDRIEAGAAFEYDLGMQLSQIEQKRTQELANENLTAEEKRSINLKYDNDRKAAEKAVADNKMQLAQQTFSNFATILGKESAAGKAIAVAQTTIETYKSAVSAYAGMVQAVPGPVGIALGAVAAAASVATGIANVKKITSTKTPKAEKGALFSIGGRRHSEGGTLFTGADGTQFEAEQGELIGVMNRNAARHFMAFNNAFPAGSSSAANYFAGGGIVSREMAGPSLNTDELASKIAEANRALPAPVVAVQDIVTEGNSYVQVRDGANF